MPFGLRNAAYAFQRFIGQVLRGLTFTFHYIKEMFVFTDTEGHIDHLRQLFTQLKSY